MTQHNIEDYLVILNRARDALLLATTVLQTCRNKLDQEIALLNAGGSKPLEGHKVERLVPEVHK